MVRGPEVRYHGAVVASDDDGAAARVDFRIDAVFGAHAGFVDGRIQDGRVFVVAYAAEKDYRLRGEDVLGAASSVLGGAAGEKSGVVVVENLFVDGEVLLLGKDGIVGLEAVFVKEGLVSLEMVSFEFGELGFER